MACAEVPTGSGGAGGGGGTGGCSVAADCGVDTACIAWSCASNACVSSATPEGPLPDPAQVPGDCKRLHCDGQGNLISLPDDADVPPTSECASPSCFQGMIDPMPAPIGTPCGEGGQCDDAGVCVTCFGPSDCPAGTACEKVECTGGRCVTSNQPIGYADASFQQIAGDCHKVACDGQGNQVTIIDDADVPGDGEPCTDDLCTNGVPSHVPATNMCGGCTTAFQEQGYCFMGVCYACP